MKHIQKIVLLIVLSGCSFAAYPHGEIPNKPETSLTGLLIPAILAAFGYLGKTLYEIYTNNQKRRRELIENRLRYFYWPISIRLKANENTYQYLFKGKKIEDTNSTTSIIARHVEKNVLMKNHEEILAIIREYRYLAESDSEFEEIIKGYIRHVTIYKAFLDAGINEYPGVATDAPFPTKIDSYFYNKTDHFQKTLERMKL